MSTQQLGHYKILKRLGQGGMASVYQGQDLRLNRYVAVKILNADFTSDAERLARFYQEARIAAFINHPGVLTIHDVDEDGGEHFIVTELVEGKTLRERIDRGPLEELEAAKIAVDVAEALEAAHRYWVVHRDIKPENVMIRDDGIVKVLDFGLAKFKDPAAFGDAGSPVHTRPGMVPGSIRYVAPERLRGEAAEPRTDVFSLGAVFYEMLSGAAPFEGANIGIVLQKIAVGEVEPIESQRPDISRDVAEIVRRAMEPDPDRRYQSATEMLVDLRRARARLEWVGISKGG